MPDDERPGFSVMALTVDPESSVTVALHSDSVISPSVYMWRAEAWASFTRRLSLVEGGMLGVLAALGSLDARSRSACDRGPLVGRLFC